jgi:hypothetical protein
MDYYGSITMTNKDIKASILHHLAEYPEDYVVELSEKLGVYKTTYSVSGWNVFDGPDWVKEMRDILLKETEDAEKNLAIVKVAVGSPDFPEDMEIAKQIAGHLR